MPEEASFIHEEHMETLVAPQRFRVGLAVFQAYAEAVCAQILGIKPHSSTPRLQAGEKLPVRIGDDTTEAGEGSGFVENKCNRILQA